MSKNAQYEKLVDFLNTREACVADTRNKIRLTLADNINVTYSDVEGMALIGGFSAPVSFLNSLIRAVDQNEMTKAKAVKEARIEADSILLVDSRPVDTSRGYSLITANTVAFWEDFDQHML